MGFLKKLLGNKSKLPISLNNFVEVLVSFAANLNAIRENVELTTFPEEVKKTLRNEIIYLQIFAIEMTVGFCFSQNMKDKIMEKFYELLFITFDEMQKRINSAESLSVIITEGLDRTIPEYWLAVNDNEVEKNPPISVGRVFSNFCGYPNDYDITTIGSDLFDAYIKNMAKVINEYEIQEYK